MPVIWIPDGEPFEVEWYTSDGKATGIERMSTGFMRHEVAPRRTGFRPPDTMKPRRHDLVFRDDARFGPILSKRHDL